MKVVEHEEFYSNPRQLMVYRLGLEKWIGFSQSFLDNEVAKFKKERQSQLILSQARSDIKEIKDNLYELKRAEAESTLSRLIELTNTILYNNPNVPLIIQEKIPFTDMIDLAHFNKDYQKVLHIFENYSSYATISDKQMEKVLSRVQFAQEKLIK